MDKQPTALRLADELESEWVAPYEFDSAAELRRLHEQNQDLLEALKRIAAPNIINQDPRVETYREALREIARAAIAKATIGEQA